MQHYKSTILHFFLKGKTAFVQTNYMGNTIDKLLSTTKGRKHLGITLIWRNVQVFYDE